MAEPGLKMRTTDTGLVVTELEYEGHHEAGHCAVALTRGAYGVRARVNPHTGKAWTEASGLSTLDDAVMIAAGTAATNMIYGENQPVVRSGDAQEMERLCDRLGVAPDEVVVLAAEAVRALESDIREIAAHIIASGGQFR